MSVTAFMNHKPEFDIAVIGGGIVGLAAAYKIALSRPRIRLAILEKEAKLASHQTGHNSGVIHSGSYYKPGSAKAKTCADGRKQLVAFAKQYNIPYEICGKIIIAVCEKDLPCLERIYNNSISNGIEGIRKINQGEIRKIEPCCAGVAGLYVPCTGIIDFVAVANMLAELIRKQNPANIIFTSHNVVGFEKQPGRTDILTNLNPVSARFVVNCAGLQCDRIARLDGANIKMRIVPFRGDYYDLKKEVSGRIKSLIYPVPDPQFPFLGVHFTRQINGGVECGPNAVFSLKREGYGKLDFNLRDAWESLTYPGTLKLFMKNWRYGLGEYVRAFSKTLFVKQLQRLVPSIQKADLAPGNSGVRAQAVGADGKPIDDFMIGTHDSAIHVLNAPSPAATASLAVADHITNLVVRHFKL